MYPVSGVRCQLSAPVHTEPSHPTVSFPVEQYRMPDLIVAGAFIAERFV
jgi:hypothetical protein